MTERQKAIREMCNAATKAKVPLSTGEVIYAWGCGAKIAGVASNRQLEQVYDGEDAND